MIQKFFVCAVHCMISLTSSFIQGGSAKDKKEVCPGTNCQKYEGFYKTGTGSYSSICRQPPANETEYLDENLPSCTPMLECKGAKYISLNLDWLECPKGFM